MLHALIPASVPEKTPDAQHLRLYSLYRVCASGTLLGSHLWPYVHQQSSLLPAIFWTLVLFFSYALILSFRTDLLQRLPDTLLKLQTVIDIGFIVTMMHFIRDSQTAIGMLLVINIVFASLISDGRYSIFYAAIATIGILSENTYQVLHHTSQDNDYSNSVLLSLSCFATAWLAHTLATRMQSSEKLATQRGEDIEYLAKINALITQQMPNGVLVIDQHQYLRHYNQQASTLLGLDEQQLQDCMESHTSLDLLIPSLTDLLHSLPTRRPVPQDAVKLTLNNRDLGIRFHGISEDIENGVVIFMEDWSQIQTQAHQVKLAALGRLTANIAHEIRNPLSAISHANQLLQEDAQDPGTVRMLQIIADNVQRLDQIIKDVLELNRRDRTNQEQFSIQQFAQEFYQQFCAVERIDPHCFTLHLLDQDSDVIFDRRHINQILWNLCKNGWRHSRQQVDSLQLRITSDKSGQFVHIQVQDNGSGIDANIQPHIFEPFMTTEKTGTGLGLYIARELAEANGARLSFASHAAGTEFSLTIKKATA